MEWLKVNKQWLFGGVLTTFVAVFFLALLLYYSEEKGGPNLDLPFVHNSVVINGVNKSVKPSDDDYHSVWKRIFLYIDLFRDVYNIRITPEVIVNAAASANLSKLSIYRTNGNDINVVDNRGLTPLNAAILEGHIVAVHWLIENGADISSAAGEINPLELTIMLNDPLILEILIEYGLDLNIPIEKVIDGLTVSTSPLSFAEALEAYSLFDVIVQHQVAPEDIENTGRELISLGYGYSGKTSLDNENFLESIRNIQREYGLPVHGFPSELTRKLISSERYIRDSGIFNAAHLGDLDQLAYLISRKNISVNSRSSKGWTPLMFAVVGGHYKIIRKLVDEFGANPDLLSKNGLSALSLAHQNNKQDIIGYLSQKSSLNSYKGVELSEVLAPINMDEYLLVLNQSDESASQEYILSKKYPKEFIKSQWNKDNFISMITYLDNLWFVTTTNEHLYASQSYFNGSKFPKEKIKEGWEKGQAISSIAHTGSQWTVVMSKYIDGTRGAGWTSSKSIREDLAKYIGENRRISHLRYVDGYWVIIFHANTGYADQKYIVSKYFPSNEIMYHMKNGFDITAIEKNQTEFVVVLSKGAGLRSQKWLSRKRINQMPIRKHVSRGYSVAMAIHTPYNNGAYTNE